MAKIDMKKVKQNFSGVEQFARRHTFETLTVVAILVATVSAWSRFFVGTMGWSVLFMAIGAILGVFFPSQVEKGMKKVYSFSVGDKKAKEYFIEGAKIAVALFLPFLYFGFLGLMAGTAYHYYSRFEEKE